MEPLISNKTGPAVTFIVAEEDNVCTLEEAEKIFETITRCLDEKLIEDRVLHTWREIDGDHDLFMNDEATEEEFVKNLIGTIEDEARLMVTFASAFMTYLLL